MKLFRMNPVVRLSLGLSLFIMTLLLGLEMLGVLPDPQQAILDARKKTCESLAIYASLAIQSKDFDAIQTTIDVLRQRNPDILSVALRKENGPVLAITGDHAGHWHDIEGKSSTLQNVKVPLFMGKDDVRWGRFEVSFAAMHPNMLYSIWARPMVKILALTLPLAFVGFFLIMKKTLRHLDPSAVVPERVKHALDSLVEGVILMDHKERIVLANKAFEETFGDGRTSFLGRRASELHWQSPRTRRQVEELPWQRAMRAGDRQAAVALHAENSGGEERTFMVSGAPIIDTGGKIRGALATFDDVTQVEAQNRKLENTLNALAKSRDEVRKQNQALQRLATQDPLTGCLNREAFYQRLEKEFDRAGRDGHELTCIIVEIDGLKLINNAYGHSVGDNVLRQVSSIVRDGLGDRDVVCRYGGVAFSLLLPKTAWLDALSRAERIRYSVSAKTIEGVQVTVSLGVSALEFRPGRPSELLDQTDQALRHAKDSGGDMAVVYNELLEASPDGDSGEKPKVDQGIPRDVVKALMLALEHRDKSTAEHCRKVADLCLAVARSQMPRDECTVLEIAGMLHDIGKIGLSDAILRKQGLPAEKERQVMKVSERRSVEMISSAFLSPEVVEIMKYQSRWFDGSNAENDTPLKGEQIPLGARILHIADALDAMVSGGPKARSYEEACQELRRRAGTQFDPQQVENFIFVANMRDDTRKADDSVAPDSIELEIDREVESLLHT